MIALDPARLVHDYLDGFPSSAWNISIIPISASDYHIGIDTELRKW